MKNAFLSVALPALCFSVLLPTAATAQGATRVVDDDGRASGVSCEAASPAPASIQAAINLSGSGDTILVCPGLYAEQLKIVAKSLTIRGVTSGVLNQVLIRPAGVVANSTNAFSGAPIAAVIAVEDSSHVTLRNLTVDGVDNGLTDCNPTLVGVFFRNASGEVQATAVREVRLVPELGTCQSGYGIFVQSALGGASKLTISSSTVHGYQKVGILGNETGTELQVLDSTVTGDGATTTIAQNGIQIGFGATGTIAGNLVVNHVYTCPTFPCETATNVLVFESDKVRVRGNTTAKAVTSIYLVRSDGSVVRNNTVSDSDVFDGIAVLGNRNHVHLNRVSNSAEFALSIEGEDNLVENNVINEAPCGIYSNGTGNSLVHNSTFNTELTTCAPFTLTFRTLSLNTRSRSSSSFGLDAAGLVPRAPAPAR